LSDFGIFYHVEVNKLRSLKGIERSVRSECEVLLESLRAVVKGPRICISGHE